VAILESHALVAEAIAHSLAAEEDINVRLATADPAELLEFLASDQVDVVLVDFDMRTVKGGLDMFRHRLVQSGRVRVVVISSSNTRDDALAARLRGAAGFVPKSASIAQIVEAIFAVDGGASYFDRAAQNIPPLTPPSRRELELLETLRSGATNAGVGRALGISTRTVESHLRRLFNRYGVSSRSELLMLALRQEWMSLHETRESKLRDNTPSRNRPMSGDT
jgi:DNA-binding NarL/FixJ family response regulator